MMGCAAPTRTRWPLTLAPRPRAALILRDVLGWPAKDVAELLGDSVNSVNSALQRARAGMREHLPSERQEWTGADGDADNGKRRERKKKKQVSLSFSHSTHRSQRGARHSPWTPK